jgi:DNA-binding transcriptional LysR family regulator
MELRELRSLALLAELGSITGAAERLHLSPAAIHRQLKVLEEELALRLYDKVGRRLQLTPASVILLPHLKAILAAYDGALATAEELKGLRRGVVRIGAGPTISSYLLPEILMRYHEVFPGIDLFVQTGNSRALIDGLGKGVLDLVMLVSDEGPEEASISIEGTWDFEIVFVSDPSQAPRTCHISSLRECSLVLFQKGSRIENLIDHYFAEMNFHPRVAMRFDNAEAIKAMIRAKLGISMLPFWVVDEDLRRGGLSLIQQRERPLFGRLVLLTRNAGYVAEPVAAFIELTRKFPLKKPRLTNPSRRSR